MLAPLVWIKDFVDINVSAEKLAEKLLLSGTKVEEIRKQNGEVVFDLEITPNRPDTLSILGVAREIAAIFKEDLKPQQTNLVEFQKTTSNLPRFKVQEKNLCLHYSLVILDNVKVEPSRGWIQEYLKLAGVRAINNIVDITNFVTIEMGQPMHAFDQDKIKGELVLRAAKAGEKVTTLDGIERVLEKGALIIEDSEKLVDLAGLMGGENSQVDQNTKKILLLVPVYEPVAIRKASLFTNLRTEASNRFEKKLDPNLHPKALNRAINLLIENASATLGSKIVSVGYPVEEKKIDFDLTLVKKVLGIDLKSGEVINLLTPLGFSLTSSPLEEDHLQIQVPSYRTDVSLPEDILEEIGRMYGYNNLPKTLPRGELPVQKEFFQTDILEVAREIFLSSGYSETTGHTLVSEEDLKRINFPKEKALKVLHPTSSDFVYLRPTLLINALRALAVNQDRQELSFFEMAKEFHPETDPKTKLPSQPLTALLVTTSSYLEIKGVVEDFLRKLDLIYEEAPLQPTAQLSFGVELKEGKEQIAKIGQVDKKLLQNFEIVGDAFIASLNLEYLQTRPSANNYFPNPKFPSVKEDISMFVSKVILASEIVKEIEKSNKLVKQAEIFDVFEKDRKKSLAVRINFNSPQSTLTNEEVKKVRSEIEKILKKKFKAEIRKE